MGADGLQQAEGAHQIRLHEGRRIEKRIVIVRFGGEVDHGIGIRYQLVDELTIADVALDKAVTVGRQALQRAHIAGVGELVEHHHRVVGVVEHMVNEVGADETGTAGDE